MAAPPDDRCARIACSAWLGDEPRDLVDLGRGGFSGSAVFAVQAAAGRFVLKAFPVGTAADRAAWVHRLMRHLRQAGVAEIPEPQTTPAGETLVADPWGRLWELVAHVAGTAVAAPTAAQAAAACAALARVHRAAATLPHMPPRVGPAPGMLRRISRAEALLAAPWSPRRGLRAGDAADPLADALRPRLARAIALFESGGQRGLTRLAALQPPTLSVQAVLRDVWAEHVLFAPDPLPRFAGFIDLHAAGADSPVADLARLLGSWLSPAGSSGGLLDRWVGALAAYEAERPLHDAERRAIPAWHAAGVVFGLDNWFQWILDERRVFTHPEAVLGRVDRLLEDLPQALETLATIGPIGELRPV